LLLVFLKTRVYKLLREQGFPCGSLAFNVPVINSSSVVSSLKLKSKIIVVVSVIVMR
jgi:hypothetical protein